MENDPILPPLPPMLNGKFHLFIYFFFLTPSLKHFGLLLPNIWKYGQKYAMNPFTEMIFTQDEIIEQSVGEEQTKTVSGEIVSGKPP